MRKRITMVAMVVLAIILTGCAKCVRTETTVQVEVVDTYYQKSYVQPIVVAGHCSMIVYPESYGIMVEYEGREYMIEGEDTYRKCSGRIGESVDATLETKTYSDGSKEQQIAEIK